MPIKRVPGGWKYGDSKVFKNKPTKAQIAAIEASMAEKKKKAKSKKK